jgi:hypothetical protein
VELESRHPHGRRRLSMAASTHVFTIARVAQILREDEQLLWDLAINMEPEDGGTDEQHTMAFTDRGREYLQELLAEHKRTKTSPQS